MGVPRIDQEIHADASIISDLTGREISMTMRILLIRRNGYDPGLSGHSTKIAKPHGTEIS